MKTTQDQRSPDGAEPARGDTASAQGETQELKPRTPNERDESTDSQGRTTVGQQRMGKMAHDDVREGQRDTDKGPVLDATYERVIGHTKK